MANPLKRLSDGVKGFRDGVTGITNAQMEAAARANASQPSVKTLTASQALECFRSSHLCNKVIKIPVDDALRNWRTWSGDVPPEDIEKIVAVEQQFGIRDLIHEAMIGARLYGGHSLIISISREEDLSLPLDPATIKPDELEFIEVVGKDQYNALQIDRDFGSETYRKPKVFPLPIMQETRRRVTTDIHPSRVIVFRGQRNPNTNNTLTPEYFWGDSLLRSVLLSIHSYEKMKANIDALLYKAKLGIVKIPNMEKRQLDGTLPDDVVADFLGAIDDQANNTAFVALDKEYDYSQHQYNFAQLPQLLEKYQADVSSAADIPSTRLWAESPDGMNATGESDTLNYAQMVMSLQRSVQGSLRVLDEVIVRSAGVDYDKVSYKWGNPIPQSQKQIIDNARVILDMITKAAEGNYILDEEANDAVKNLLLNSGFIQGEQ